MSIEQLSADRQVIAERASEIVKACIAGVALSVAIKQCEQQDTVPTEDKQDL